MGSQTVLVLFVLAAGFITAGLLNALHRLIWVAEEEDEVSPMVLRFDSLPSGTWSAFVCVFAGPFLVLQNGYHFWRLAVLPTPALGLCAVISAIWSFCSGVVIVELALALAAI